MEELNISHLQITRKFLRIDPVERKTATDQSFIIIWGMIFSTWVCGVIYVHVNYISVSFESLFIPVWKQREESEEEYNVTFTLQILLRYVFELRNDLISFFYHRSEIIAAVLMLSFIIILVFLILGRYKSCFCAYTGVTFMIILPLFYGYKIYKFYFNYISIINGDIQVETIRMICFLEFLITETIKLFYMLLAMYCIIKVETIRYISTIVEDTLRIYLRFPILILFSVFIYASAAIVIIMSLKSILTLKFQSLRCPIMSIVTYYLVAFLHYYGVAVISKMVASWNWVENKPKNPNALIFKCMATVAKYQFGSIAFAATGIGPLVAVYTYLSSFKKSNNTSKTLFNRIMEVPLTIYLVYDIAKYTVIINSIYGKNFSRSVRKALRLLRKHSCMSFSFIWVFYGMMLAASGTIISSSTIIMYKSNNLRIFSNFEDIYFSVMYTFSILLLPFFLVVDTIGQTNYLCMVQDEEIDNSNDILTLKGSASIKNLEDIETK